MKRYCFALDLNEDPNLIEEYKAYHKEVWPEILDDIKESGISTMDIYSVENRLFMIMEVIDEVAYEESKLKEPKAIVKKWEDLMWKYQKALPNSKPNEKWRLMDHIFKL